MMNKRTRVLLKYSTLSAGLLACLVGLMPTYAATDKNSAITYSAPMASLPVIQSTVLSLIPTFGGKVNPIIMDQLCALVKGEQTQVQFERFFSDKAISLQALAKQDPGFALLVDKDPNKKITACSAYLASQAFILPDAHALLKQQTKRDAESPLNSDLNQNLSQKLATLKTNAEVFAVIAERNQSISSRSLGAHQQEIVKQFSILAGHYLQRLQQYSSLINAQTIQELDQTNLTFSSPDGYHFRLRGTDAQLQLHGINWYGDGELLGKRHFIQVTFFASSAADNTKN
jgi:hypothetical protein